MRPLKLWKTQHGPIVFQTTAGRHRHLEEEMATLALEVGQGRGRYSIFYLTPYSAVLNYPRTWTNFALVLLKLVLAIVGGIECIGGHVIMYHGVQSAYQQMPVRHLPRLPGPATGREGTPSCGLRPAAAFISFPKPWNCPCCGGAGLRSWG